MIIEGLGQIHPGASLGAIRLNGETKLIVNPWAAIGTDALLLTMSASTFVLSNNPILKTLSILGGIWGMTAIALETSKLTGQSGSDPISREY